MREQRPVLLVEIEQRLHDVPIQDVWGVLEDLGYHGWFWMDGRWTSTDHFDVDRHQLDVIERIDRSGYLRNSFVNLRSYISNFVFMPPDRPAPGGRRRSSNAVVEKRAAARSAVDPDTVGNGVTAVGIPQPK